MRVVSEATKEKNRLRRMVRYAENKEREREAMRAYRIKNAEAIKAHKQLAYLKQREDPAFIKRLREYSAANKAEKREYDRHYRLVNAEKLDQLKQLWRADNADLVRAAKSTYKAKRRAKVRAGDSSKQVKEWLEKVEKVCTWCGDACEADFHIDHIYPLATGGEHRVTNLCIACPSCNIRKSALPPEEFCTRMGFNFTAIIERHRCDVGMLRAAA
jgi:5-methylcytosine-specific restriction endonuclease McrA